MTKQELLAALRDIVRQHEEHEKGRKPLTGIDTEAAHSAADGLLIEFIDDGEISEAYQAIPKWYA